METGAQVDQSLMAEKWLSGIVFVPVLFVAFKCLTERLRERPATRFQPAE